MGGEGVTKSLCYKKVIYTETEMFMYQKVCDKKHTSELSGENLRFFILETRVPYT